jgi:hypothetical protein
VGEYAYLKVGSFYFSYFKYALPFPWMVVFDSSKDPVLKTTVKDAKKKLRMDPHNPWDSRNEESSVEWIIRLIVSGL